MPFDLSSAKPVSRFDLASAKPVVTAPTTNADISKLPLEQREAAVQAEMMNSPAFGAPSSGVGDAIVSAGKGVLGGLEGGLSLANNIGAGALAGVTAPFVATDDNDAANYIRDFVENNSYHPHSDAGKEMMARLSQFMSPVDKSKEVLGDKTLDATGSPLAATGASMIPDFLMMLAGGPKAAGEGAVLKEPPLKIDVTPTGQTTATLGHNGKSVFDAQESGKYLQIKRADIDPELQGNGHGTRVMKALVDNAEDRGLKLASDVSVSPAQARVYDKLQEQGLHVTKNPANINPQTGNLVSLDPRKPVFEVSKTRAAEDMTPEQAKQHAVDTLLANDVPLRTGERGDGPWNQTAAKLGRAGDTFAGGPSGKQAVQDRAFTKAVFKKAGMDVENVTPASMEELKQNVSGLYNQAHALPIELDGEFVKGISDLASKAERSPDSGVGAGMSRLVENISKNSQVIDGKPMLPTDYVNQLRSELGSQWMSANGAGAKEIGGELMQLLDDAVERKAPPAQAAAAKAARLKFHQMKQIEDSLVLTDKGMVVSPNKLVNTLSKKRNRSEYFYGTGDNQELVALAKAGKQILGDRVRNSGTTTRALDVGAVVDAAMEPTKALGHIANATASILTGRFANELNMGRGTAADISKKNFATAYKKSLPSKTAETFDSIKRGTAVVLTEEQKRKRQAEALRR